MFVSRHIFRVIFSKKTSYKKSIDSANAEYRYYGKLDSKSRPNGTGVLLKNWGYDNYNDLPQGVYAGIVYIGNFKDGYMSGYGILFDEVNGTKCVDYEGELKKGCGTEKEHSTMKVEKWCIRENSKTAK